jgi:putative DNA primase/helicase
MREQIQLQDHTKVILPPSFVQRQRIYEKEFINAMRQAGIILKGELIADGNLHRFAPYNKNTQDGWYVFYGMAGVFGDWSQDIHQRWSLNKENLSFEEKERLSNQLKRAQQIAEQERQHQYETIAKIALERWNSYSKSGTSLYLSKKQVKPFGVRFDQSSLVVPLKDVLGKLWSLEWIYPDGIKRFLKGGRKKGCFHTLGALANGKSIIVSEGYATGASLFMAAHLPTIIAFDAGNLEAVVEELKRAYPKSPLLIAGDDDTSKEKNIGRIKAEEAARKHKCLVTFPKFKSIEGTQTDFNDLHVLEGLEEVKSQIKSALQSTTLKALNLRELLSLEVRPREMILGPILPEQGLTMIHAPRGIGKTHVSLMIAYAVATGTSMFQEKWISTKPHKVLIVDGEMPLVVMQERLARIVNSSRTEMIIDENLKIITPDLQEKSIPDLSTTKGQQLIEEHLKDIKLLILDNYSALCRGGRENEAESWIPLQEWFLDLRRRGLSVLLIHHSNKSGGQRGTSRKEDLLDTIITLGKPDDYDPREGARFEVHYEKARGFYGEEAAPFEAWLKEERERLTWHIRPLEECQIERVIDLKKEGLTQRDIALETGLSPATVNRRLKEAKEKGFLEA